MPKFRQDRINDNVAKELNEILSGIKDPRVSSNFVTITSAEVTKDLKFAKIYFGTITGEPSEIKKGLESASGYMRSQLAQRLNMRMTPSLTFQHDDSARNGAHISEILKTLDIKEED